MRAVCLIVLLPLVTSCVTVETEFYIPDYVLPDFPVCRECVDQGDFVLVDSEFFVSLAKFKNEYEEFCLFYEQVRKIKEGEE